MPEVAQIRKRKCTLLHKYFCKNHTKLGNVTTGTFSMFLGQCCFFHRLRSLLIFGCRHPRRVSAVSCPIFCNMAPVPDTPATKHYVFRRFQLLEGFCVVDWTSKFKNYTIYLTTLTFFPTCLPTYLSTYLPTCLSTCLSAYLPTYIPTYLPT